MLPKPTAQRRADPPPAEVIPDRRFLEASRAHAYGQVVDVLRDLGPAKLEPTESEVVRNAADTLLICAGLRTTEADAALAAVSALARDLVAGERWTGERGEYLLSACAPAGQSAQRSPERAIRPLGAPSTAVRDDRGQPDHVLHSTHGTGDRARARGRPAARRRRKRPSAGW